MAAYDPRNLNPPRYRNEEETGLGTVTSITAGTGITVSPSPITGAGTVSLETLGVDPSGTYGDATNVSQITVDAQGRVTAAADVPITTGIVVQDEGTPLATSATTLNFTGASVTASGAGSTKTINITSPVVMDNTAAGDKFPTAPQTTGCWYGTGTKGLTTSSSVAIGNGANANHANAVAIGTDARNQQAGGVAIGYNTLTGTGGNVEVAIGYSAVASNSGTAVGASSSASILSVAVGKNAQNTNSSSVVIGSDARAGSGCVAAGLSATAGSSSVNDCIAIGRSANASVASAVAIGRNAVGDIANGIAIGHGANTLSAEYPIAIVTNATGINATPPAGAITYLGVTVNGASYKLLLQVP